MGIDAVDPSEIVLTEGIWGQSVHPGRFTGNFDESSLSEKWGTVAVVPEILRLCGSVFGPKQLCRA